MQLKKTKSIFALVLTVAMVIGMSLLPVSALEVDESNEYISVDFSSGALVQSQYGDDMILPEAEVLGEAPKIEMDATLNRNVAVFDTTGAYTLGVAMEDFAPPQDYSFEMVLRVSSELQGTEGEIYVIGNVGNSSETGIWIADDYVTVYANDGSTYQQVQTQKCKYDQWMYIVGTYDDAAKEITLYVDGVNCGTTAMKGPVKFWTRYGATSSKLVLGADSDYGGGGGLISYHALKGKVAYTKVYDTVVSAEDVVELYAASGVASAAPSTSPSTSPSTEPSTSPTNGDGNTTTSPSSGSNATAIPTKGPDQPNTNTFDMGILSFAAVALSSFVAVKKRK